MGLFSSFKFGQKSAASAASSASLDAADMVREARARARRRLIGAAVLLGIGIIGFPLLFESRPRPIPVDVAIDIPPREGAAPLAVPPLAKSDAHRPDAQPAEPIDEPPASAAVSGKAAASSSTGTAAKTAAGLAAAAGVAAVAVTHHEDSARPAASAVKPDAKAVLARPGSSAAAGKPAPAKPEAKTAPKADDQARDAAAKAKEAAVAKAKDREAAARKATDAKPEAKADARPSADKVADQGRFVVQVGAFAEVAAAHEARMKVERLGMKTYTQVIESPTGRRIRVRAGPYATKAEAEKAAARIKAGGGLAAAVLVL